MSPDLAFDLLRDYRRDFEPRRPGDLPYSAMSVLTFASDDADAVLDFEAGWALTMANLRRGVREPLRPEQVREFARAPAFLSDRGRDARMVTGPAKAVVSQLREMMDRAEVDELIVVTPGLDRPRRAASLVELASAWRDAT
jgi:alkanesulfonate monooxygenase SsuD/methylene tetrahydromethanopterin reductase-like flavin-dependent oxidoreductase (luciferase family)